MSLTSDLEAARALIDTRAKWKQGFGANGQNGRYCAGHAVVHAADDCNAAFFALSRQLPKWRQSSSPMGNIVWFNDSLFRRHKTVLKLFDRAIAASKA